jgi:hypothetical protein
MTRRLSIWCLAALSLIVPSTAFAQRELRWDSLDVTAHLDASGTLHVSETQTMVFTGDWNGGERKFRIHPRHTLSFIGIYREESGRWQPLTEDSSLDDVDDFAWTDRTTLRWRSRRSSDPPFADTTIRYELKYELSGILLKEGDSYVLDHDFAFRDRDGAIDRFVLRLTLDPAWQAVSDLHAEYTAGPLASGETFVLNLPLRFTGAGAPSTFDLTRPREIAIGVSILLGVTVLAVIAFFVHEQSRGRFAPLPAHVDEPWLREHILKYPAEIVGAAWDEQVGTTEVVALIARMVRDGTLESHVGKGNAKSASMSLALKVDRATLSGHERALVDGLFFDGRNETSTSLVKSHYKSKGFDPADVIRAGLEAAVASALPAGAAPRRFPISSIVFTIGIGALLIAWYLGRLHVPSALILTLAMLIVAGIGQMAGVRFQAYLWWDRGEAVACLVPAVTIAIGVAAFLWFYAGTGRIELDPINIFALVAIACALTNASINALKSRRRREAMAVRKAFAAGRAFFMAELRKERPALRDDWYPWLLAFGLGKQMDDWSAQRPSQTSGGRRVSNTPTSVTTSSSSDGWTGFGGGRSGGAGGGASWQAAAGGMAAGVSVPSSSGSGGGSSSSGGSSSGGSSGGGGGGGW